MTSRSRITGVCAIADCDVTRMPHAIKATLRIGIGSCAIGHTDDCYFPQPWPASEALAVFIDLDSEHVSTLKNVADHLNHEVAHSGITALRGLYRR